MRARGVLGFWARQKGSQHILPFRLWVIKQVWGWYNVAGFVNRNSFGGRFLLKAT